MESREPREWDPGFLQWLLAISGILTSSKIESVLQDTFHVNIKNNSKIFV